MEFMVRQIGAPCPIGIERKAQSNSFNFIEPEKNQKPVRKGEIKNSGAAVSTTAAARPARKKNIIKIRLADNPKDIIIKFADKETLIKSLKELLDF